MAQLDHIGVAVDDVHKVIDDFARLLDTRPYKSDTVAAQQVRTHFLDGGTTKLELLESLDPDSPVQRFLDRRGEGLHHLAFEVEDLRATMNRLRDAGFTLLSDEPQPGADDTRIAFVHPKDTHGVLVEFCETTPAEWTPTTVPHRNGPLALYERGDRNRPCLVLLHGAAGTTQMETAPLMRRLESHFHLVGVDLSGHGNTALPADDTLTLDRFVEDVCAALDAVERSACHLFGFSLGSAVALQVARTHPDRVDRLALLGPNAEWDRSLVETIQAHLHLETMREEAPAQAARIEAAHREPERLLETLRAYLDTLPAANDEMDRTLSTVSHPTLVAGLDQDPFFPVDATQAVYDRLRNARLAILPGRQHSLEAAPLSMLASLLRRHLEEDAPSGIGD